MNKTLKIIGLFLFFIITSALLIFLLKLASLKHKLNINQPAKLTNISQEETKYENINVYTREERDNDGRSLLYVSYPVTENEAINLELKKKSQIFIDEYKTVAQSQEKAYLDYLKKTGKIAVSMITEYIQHFDVSFASDKYLLFVFDQYKSTGGTGSDDSISVLFNRETGKELALSSLFSTDNYLEILSDKSQKILNERMANEAKLLDFTNEEAKTQWLERGMEQIKAGTKTNSENFDSLSISDNRELIIIFDKYQVGPGSDGAVKVKIPLSEISQILSPEVKKIFEIRNTPPKENNPGNEGTEASPSSSIDCSKEKCVALTFDDGPSVYTDNLLNILKENNIKASFFVLGQSAKIQPDTIRRMVQEGHVVGNHSWDHKNLTKLSSEEIQKQLSDTDKLIKKIANYNTTLLRPPYGSYNANVLASVNKAIVLWNIDSEDWKDKDTDIVAERISQAKANSIILAHDIYPSTIEAIPQVIANLKQKGLKFVNIYELFAPEILEKRQVVRYRQN